MTDMLSTLLSIMLSYVYALLWMNDMILITVMLKRFCILQNFLYFFCIKNIFKQLYSHLCKQNIFFPVGSGLYM